MGEFLKFIVYSVIGAIIFMVVYSLWFNPSLLSSKYEDIKEEFSENSITGNVINTENHGAEEPNSEDLAISKCRNEYNKYSKVAEEKYEQLDYSLLKIEKINNKEEAKEFDLLYGGSLSSTLEKYSIFSSNNIDYDFDYPIIAISAKLKINVENQINSMPQIFYCESNGKMSEWSKKTLLISF